MGVMTKPVLCLVAVALAVVACGSPGAEPPDARRASPTAPAPGAGSGDYEGMWELVSGRSSDGGILVSEQWQITMTFEGSELGGIAACNYYGGSYEIDGDSFAMGGGSKTEMGCAPQVLEAETRYMDALYEVDTIARSGDTFTMSGPGAELVFEYVPEVPRASLTGVRWEFDSVIHGEGDDATASSVEPGWIRFDDDGTMTGNSGCEEMSGDWSLTGDSISFGFYGTEGSCPPELREHNGYFESLGDGFRFTIAERRLTIRPRHSDLSLVFRARD